MFLSYIQTITQKGGTEMKTKGFIMLAVFISCFLWINGAWAATAGYIDSGQNSTTRRGRCWCRVYRDIVSWQRCANTAIWAILQRPPGIPMVVISKATAPVVQGSLAGLHATTGNTYGGYFRSNSTNGIGVYGYANATTGNTYGGYFESSSTSGKGVFG